MSMMILQKFTWINQVQKLSGHWGEIVCFAWDAMVLDGSEKYNKQSHKQINTPFWQKSIWLLLTFRLNQADIARICAPLCRPDHVGKYHGREHKLGERTNAHSPQKAAAKEKSQQKRKGKANVCEQLATTCNTSNDGTTTKTILCKHVNMCSTWFVLTDRYLASTRSLNGQSKTIPTLVRQESTNGTSWAFSTRAGF